jgi:hypothetical protein
MRESMGDLRGIYLPQIPFMGEKRGNRTLKTALIYRYLPLET